MSEIRYLRKRKPTYKELEAENARLKADNERRRGPCIHRMGELCNIMPERADCSTCIRWRAVVPSRPPAEAKLAEANRELAGLKAPLHQPFHHETCDCALCKRGR